MERRRVGIWRFVYLVACAAVADGCLIEGEYLEDIAPPSDLWTSAVGARCGDGIRQDKEACDDGNQATGDGCDTVCAIEVCFTCSEAFLGGASLCGPQCNDAAGEVCFAGVCVSCSDGMQNGTETDVDCGGACGGCTLGLACAAGGDCATGACSGGVCCNEACDTACVACNLDGSVGICAYVPENQPHEALACFGTSACDGKGACKLVTEESCAKGVDCVSGMCVAGACQ
jgi:cysteine-rich repeat protein